MSVTTTLDAGARGAAPAASPAVEPTFAAPRSGPADPTCSCGQPASEHGALGGTRTSPEGTRVRQLLVTPATACGLARWEVHAAALRRCEAVVETARFRWTCLRAPHEHHPDDHVMTAAAR